MGNISNMILSFLYALPAILISLSFHEMSHGYVSYRLGDPTAYRMGRVTLNPLKHLDPIGTLLLVASMFSGFGFGWAKPVPIDPTYYKNARRGTVLVSLAGPVSNLLLAFIFSFPMAIIGAQKGYPVSEILSSNGIFTGWSWQEILFNISSYFYMINIGLATFNILPIPPLDGSKILTAVLPTNLYFRLMQYERYIGLFFLAVILLKPGILSTILWPFIKTVQVVFTLIVSPVAGLFA